MALPNPDTHPQFYENIPTKRLLAWVFDFVVVLILCVLVLPFAAFIGIFFFPLLFLLLVVGFAYRVITLANGSATFGMRLMGMELRRHDDQPFDAPTAFIHTLGYSVSMAMMPLQILSVILMCSTERRQGLSDLVMGTVALNRRRTRLR